MKIKIEEVSLRDSIGLLYTITILCWVIYFLYYSYGDLLLEYSSLIATEEYSYLILVPFVAAFILVRRITLIKLEFSDLVFNALFWLLLVLLARLTYCTSFYVQDYALQLKALSMILVIYGFSILGLGLKNFTRLKAFFLSLLPLVPLPRELLDYIARNLSVIVGEIAGRIAGAQISYEPYGVLLSVSGPHGETIRFSIVAGCSGVVSLSTAIMAIPLVIDLALSLKKPLPKKFLWGVFMSLFLVLTMFFGNVLRIILVLVSAVNWGEKIALGVFHSTPSIIITGIAYSLLFIVYRRIGGSLDPFPNPIRKEHEVLSVLGKKFYDRRLIALNMLLVILLAVFPMKLALTPINRNNTDNIADISYLSNKYDAYFTKYIRSMYSLVTIARMTDWELRTGVPTIFLAKGYYNRTTMFIYVEGAPSRTLFHGWPVCLISQRYRVLRTWFTLSTLSTRHGTVEIKIYYILFEKSFLRGVMAYTFISIPARYGNIISSYYLKITFLSQWSVYSNLKVDTNELRESLAAGLKNFVYNIIDRYGVFVANTPNTYSMILLHIVLLEIVVLAILIYWTTVEFIVKI